MRTAGQIKMGYYPTPPRIVELIRERLDFPTKTTFAALDPCCGEGNALQQLCWDADRPDLPTRSMIRLYGIEPDNAEMRRSATKTRPRFDFDS